MTEKRPFYRFVAELNLYHRAFDNYPGKINLDAVHMEIESEHFGTYEECIQTCNEMLSDLKDYLEDISDIELVQGWEANPARTPTNPTPRITPTEKWLSSEIVHVFLFEKDEAITSTTLPVAACTITVEDFDQEHMKYVN